MGFPDSASSKEPTCQCRRHKRCRLDPWVGKIPCRRKRQPTSVFLLGNPMNRGAWESTVHRVAKSWTRLKRLSLHACIFFFQVFFPCRLLQNIEYSSLGCTVGPFFFIYFIYSSLYMLTPNSQFIPPSCLSFLVTISLVVCIH